MKDKLNNKYSKSVNIRHSIRTKLVLITIAMVFMIILGGCLWKDIIHPRKQMP